ncbi:hypothetical protein SDC9_95609 [bioreactor metagenome]|uniref:Uncharacterized protein n=1 Tax=bioreactor metagenome TaxID=1076179 RepID=A0A645A703_9ZZZZ
MRNIGDSAHPADRDALGVRLLGRLIQHVGHRGLNESGSDDVEGDPATADLAGHAAGHADETGLGGRIVHLPGRTEQRNHRAGGDDASEALLDHAAHSPADDAVGPGQVDVENLLPVLVAHPHQQGVTGDAGVGDQDLDRAVLGLHLLEGLVDRLCVGDIAGHAQYTLRRGVRDIEAGDAVSGVPQGLGDRCTDASSGAGDDGYTAA